MPTPITIDTLRQLAFATLVASTALPAWAQSNYPNRVLLISDGADATNQEEFDTIPGIGLFNGDESEDGNTGDRLYSIIAECRIRERITAVAARTTPVSSRVYAWPSLAAGFADLVRRELAAGFAGSNAPVQGWAIAYNHRDAWPVILASVTINFRIPNIIGAELYL